MKRIILSTILSLVFVGFVSAQEQMFRVMDMNHTNDYGDDTEIVEGDVVTFNTAVYEDAKLKFLTYNDSDEPIYTRVECEGMTNTNGSFMELCYGNCYYGIELFVGYPDDFAMMLQPGQHQPVMQDYFSNTDSSNDLVEYQFRFYQLDSDEFEIPGTSLRFTYRYDGIMGVSDVNSIAIAEVYPTVTKGFTNIDLKENAKVQVLNIEGKVVKNTTMNTGSNKLDLSGFTAGIYLIKFTGDSGITTIKKIIVK